MSELKRIYRTRDGCADFTFRFTTRPFSQTIRIYIENTPSYGSRDTNGHVTHRYTDAYGHHYICFDPQPTDMTSAFKIAAKWSESTWRYINTGEQF